MKHISTTKKIVVAVVVAVAVLSAYLLLVVFKQVSATQAQQYNQDFVSEVKDKLSAISGYEIVRQAAAEPLAIKDEMASTDYDLSASFLLRKLPAGSTSDTIEGDVDQLKIKLPTTDYGMTVENTQATDTQPPLLCVTASRYLDNNGQFIEQPGAGNRGRYITPADASRQSSATCDKLLE